MNIRLDQRRGGLRRTWARFWSLIRKDEQGQDLIEYALIMGFMVISVYVILPSNLMPTISNVFSKIVNVANTLAGS